MIEEEVDTTELQLVCLEKYLNAVGIFRSNDLYYDAVNKFEIVSLNRAVYIYNSNIKEFINRALDRGIDVGIFIAKVKIQGKSLKKGFQVQSHRVRFITE
jgi:coenzyme F420-reducing hydrogenase delta subunit